MSDFARSAKGGAFIAAGAVIILLQVILPAALDLATSVILAGIVFMAGRASKG